MRLGAGLTDQRGIPVELAGERKIRARNTALYRVAHWPIWIWVFFLAPGPLTFDLFAQGFDGRMGAWLAAVVLGTGVAGLRGRLPGVEPRPYIIRFTEDRPNPLYRRVCYTFAWSARAQFCVAEPVGTRVGGGNGGVANAGDLRGRGTFRLRGRCGCSAPRGGCHA